MRRFLTEEFIDNLKAPASGEIWIADTEIKGFGIRLWAGRKYTSGAFAVRTTDQNGRAVRKTFDPYKNQNWTWRLKKSDPSDFVVFTDNEAALKLSIFLDDAREWAKTEIGRLKGKLASEKEEEAARNDYEKMREDFGDYLKKQSLGKLTELVIERGSCRGWSQRYQDRLRKAFYAFDKDGRIKNKTILELNEGILPGLIEKSNISPGNLRLLRSILNVVLWNIHEMGGGTIAAIYPRHARNFNPKASEAYHEKFILEDYKKLFSTIHEIPFNWRSKICIEMCFYINTPVTCIMRGRWSHIIEATWLPYAPSERKNWYWTGQRIDQQFLEFLRRIRIHLIEEGISSDYWFRI